MTLLEFIEWVKQIIGVFTPTTTTPTTTQTTTTLLPPPSGCNWSAATQEISLPNGYKLDEFLSTNYLNRRLGNGSSPEKATVIEKEGRIIGIFNNLNYKFPFQIYVLTKNKQRNKCWIVNNTKADQKDCVEKLSPL